MGIFDDAKQKFALSSANKPKSVFGGQRAPSAMNPNNIQTLPYRVQFKGWPAGQLSTQPNQAVPNNPNYIDDHRDKAMADHAAMSQQNTTQPEQPSLLDTLLGKLTGGYQGGPDQSHIDFSSLDRALANRLSQIQGVRDQAQSGFDTSDRNVEGMHNAFKHQVETEGVDRYNKIADTQMQGLRDVSSSAVGNLEAIKASDMAKRSAMLKNLGIEEAAPAHDVGADPLNQAIASIQSRGDAEQSNAVGDRATNLAYNNTVANSIGQQGLERRGQLAQQLQGILGRLDSAKLDVQSQNDQERAKYTQQADSTAYDRWKDQQGINQNLFNTLSRAQQAAGGSTAQDTVSGFSGLAQDLTNSGTSDQDASNAMGVLSQVLSSDYYKGSNGQQSIDPTAGYPLEAVLARRLRENGVDAVLAAHLATNYANQGNTSKYPTGG
jgi:hypothetical protein